MNEILEEIDELVTFYNIEIQVKNIIKNYIGMPIHRNIVNDISDIMFNVLKNNIKNYEEYEIHTCLDPYSPQLNISVVPKQPGKNCYVFKVRSY